MAFSERTLHPSTLFQLESNWKDYLPAIFSNKNPAARPPFQINKTQMRYHITSYSKKKRAVAALFNISNVTKRYCKYSFVVNNAYAFLIYLKKLTYRSAWKKLQTLSEEKLHVKLHRKKFKHHQKSYQNSAQMIQHNEQQYNQKSYTQQEVKRYQYQYLKLLAQCCDNIALVILLDELLPLKLMPLRSEIATNADLLVSLGTG